MMHGDKLQITLSIAGRSLHLTIDRDDEFAFREAARKLSNRIDYLYKAYPKADYASILTVAALEKAIDCEKGLGNDENLPLRSKINEWSGLIDRVLANE